MISLIHILALSLSEYVENSKLLKELKEQKGMTWVAGENERFRGLTMGDAKVISGSAHKLRPETIPLATPPKLNISIPYSFNFTERYPKCDFGPMDQGKCGSCWAFSVAKAFSHRYCKKHNELRVFSPYHLAGCDRRNAGCQGGIIIPAWRYIDLRGLPLDSCQPYDVNLTSLNCTRKCFNESQPFLTNKTQFWSVARFASIPEMQLSIMMDGPVTTSIKVFNDFIYYKSGVYTHTKGEMLGHHAIEIIGWGTDKDVDYWIVSNSWGTKWGQQGLFLIKRGVNECGIEDYVAAGQVM
ncbi:Clan CA, family C1, cathepsin B-like cysteine peptidase [Tritrichomonas foetus]|uniref:Clan CA, family C1, cathepsin B-like cysteine peptidase n=1 Tax=Tritrichomonas foetus TaxID=1144522 RepID=A0A1J4KF67_9EUKA|nr:Clan CA, family C1, cathepsin B-like cysteine peptidase [Tritrichomonas foetus]|eukprot:OHT09819.1 Clan CA, family C1, cathepsin B-like cysteine peptidase [Tritrichomonas foetus]